MQISKLFKRMASIVVLTIYIVVTVTIVGNILKPISYAMYFNHDLDVIESESRSVDMVFLGASRVYRTFVPEIFEKEFDMDCVINAATAVQPIGGTYYQLEDLVEKFNPKYVVIGLSWDTLLMNYDKQRRLIVYDRLNGMTKMKYALTCFDFDEWLYLIDAYRFRNNFDISKIRQINESKQELIKSNYTLRVSADEFGQEEYYADKGFVYSLNSLEAGNVPMKGAGVFSEDEINVDNKKYLDACVKLCKEKGINLYLLIGPTSVMRLYNIENYQGANDYYSDYAKENGLIYHNLNYLKDREVFLPDTLMFDYNHVNGEGAYVISELYAEILRKDMEGIDTSEYFYADLDALKDDVNRIVSVSAEISIEDTVAHIEVMSLQNDDMTPYYQIEFSKDKENYTVLSEWSTQSKYDLEVPGENGFNIKVRAKTDNNEGIEAFHIYEF